MIFSLRSLLQSLTCLLLCSLVATLPARAETKVLTAEATYTMGDGESPSFAEAMVLQKAKQVALEQAGTYVESYTKIKNYDLSHEQIQTIAGGVLEVEVLEKTRTLVGDGLRFYVKIKATVTTDKMAELAQRIKGKNVAEEYKKLQEDYVRLSKEIETYKQLIAKAPPGQEREAALDQIRAREKEFAATQQNEAAFFHRLIAGEALVHEALAVREQLDQLFEAAIRSGQIVSFGQTKAIAIAGSPDLKIIVPVTLGISGHVLPLLKQSVRKFGGGMRRYDDKTIMIRVAEEADSEEYFLSRVRNSALILDFHLTNEMTRSCAVLNSSYSISYPTYYYLHRIYPAYSKIYSDHSLHYADHPSSTNFLVVDETPASFRATVLLSPKDAQALKGVSYRFITKEEDPTLMEFKCGIENG